MRINLFALIMTIIRFLAHCFFNFQKCWGGEGGGEVGLKITLLTLKGYFRPIKQGQGFKYPGQRHPFTKY